MFPFIFKSQLLIFALSPKITMVNIYNLILVIFEGVIMNYLKLNNINTDKYFFRLTSKERCAKKKCIAVLKKRDLWEVYLAWNRKSVNFFLLSNISTLLSKTLWWPNSMFLPEDNMLPIIYDYDGTLGFIHFWQELENTVGYTISYPDNINEQCYVDFIEFLQKNIDSNSNILNLYPCDASNTCP
jgi:hypothetical protein